MAPGLGELTGYPLPELEPLGEQAPELHELPPLPDGELDLGLGDGELPFPPPPSYGA